MREQMKGDEAVYKKELIYWHLECNNEKMTSRIPNKVDSFARLRKKDCKVTHMKKTTTASNYTIRSPYPTIHLLRQGDVLDAVQKMPDLEHLPAR